MQFILQVCQRGATLYKINMWKRVEWNLDTTKGQGTNKSCLLERGVVISGFFSLFLGLGHMVISYIKVPLCEKYFGPSQKLFLHWITPDPWEHVVHDVIHSLYFQIKVRQRFSINEDFGETL